jgi:hypothetical protein
MANGERQIPKGTIAAGLAPADKMIKKGLPPRIK